MAQIKYRSVDLRIGGRQVKQLKVVGIDVFSMGEVEQADEDPNLTSASWSDPEAGLYRRVIVRRGRVAGAIAIGPWPEINRRSMSSLTPSIVNR